MSAIRIGQVGAGFIGKVHSLAYRRGEHVAPCAEPPRRARDARRSRRRRTRRNRCPVRLGRGHGPLAGDRPGPDDHAAGQRGPQPAARRALHRRRPSRQAHPVREAAGLERRRGADHLPRGRGDRRAAPVRVHVPLHPRDPPRPPADRCRRARRHPALPRTVPALLRRGPRAPDVLAAGSRHRGRGRPRRPRLTPHRSGPVPRRRDRIRRGPQRDLHRRAAWRARYQR